MEGADLSDVHAYGDLAQDAVAWQEDAEDLEAAGRVERRGRPWWVRLPAAVVALYLFVLALSLMKGGAEALVPSLGGSIFTDGPVSTLGLGWLGALLVLSGSPVAASALTFLDGGLIERGEAFTMLTGSRLGAAFVVLTVGVLYALRGKSSRRGPVSIGVLCLVMTYVTYVPGAALGYLLLEGGAFDWLHLGASSELNSFTDATVGPLADVVRDVIPDKLLFVAGVLVLLAAFKLMDLVLPEAGAVAGQAAKKERNPWLLFGLGCLVALLTLSVSVALTLLVPVVAGGYMRREETLPYIMGANITTLADTLVAAMLLSDPDAARVVLAELVGVAAVSVLVLAFAYPLTRRSVLAASHWLLVRRARLGAFVAFLFVVPVLLIVVA